MRSLSYLPASQGHQKLRIHFISKWIMLIIVKLALRMSIHGNRNIGKLQLPTTLCYLHYITPDKKQYVTHRFFSALHMSLDPHR